MDPASKEFLKLYSLLLEERNAATEQRILRYGDIWHAYSYAKKVIKDRWPEAEELIKKDFFYAYNYAKDIIKGRWPEAEEVIKQDAVCAYEYAKNIIKDRWPEAEEIIKKDFKIAYYYAINIIKGRWPEAEEYIKSDAYFWNKYKSLICEECNGEGIIDLGIGGAEDECPTCFGKGFDLKKMTEEE